MAQIIFVLWVLLVVLSSSSCSLLSLSSGWDIKYNRDKNKRNVIPLAFSFPLKKKKFYADHPCCESLSSYSLSLSFANKPQYYSTKHAALVTLMKSSSHNSEENEKSKNVCSIVYCTGCRWGLRSIWLAQELLIKNDDGGENEVPLEEVTLIPSPPDCEGGIFIISLNDKPIWNRKTMGGFPEVHELKDIIITSTLTSYSYSYSSLSSLIDIQKNVSSSSLSYPHVFITYCNKSHLLLRAAYYAQELFSTFDKGQIKAISLCPLDMTTTTMIPGRLVISLKNENKKDDILWDSILEENQYPKAKELKQRLRDLVFPERDLGHSDVSSSTSISTSSTTSSQLKEDNTSESISSSMTMDDDDDDNDDNAMEARKYFGVL